jgi:hypothetical protein
MLRSVASGRFRRWGRRGGSGPLQITLITFNYRN